MKRNLTYSAKAGDLEGKKWFLVDADGKILGRLASKVAQVIRGKEKAIYTPHMDTGDFVIVINASKIKVTGKKLDQKMYFRHSGYPGGDTLTALKNQLAKFPDRVIVSAVRGMLPKGRLGDKLITKLKVFKDSNYKQTAQKPQELAV